MSRTGKNASLRVKFPLSLKNTYIVPLKTHLISKSEIENLRFPLKNKYVGAYKNSILFLDNKAET